MIPSGATIAPEDREAWLAERRKGLGASDCAAALGLSPYKTPLTLYYEKLGELPPELDTPAMRRGRALEQHVLDEYEAGRDVECQRQVFYRHPDHPWMTATVDGVVWGQPLDRPWQEEIVEAKVVGWRAAREWGEDGTDDVPRHVLCQVHHQLAVTGAQRCDVAALVGGSDFRVYPIHRDDGFCARLIQLLSIYWDRVVRRDPDPFWVMLPADAPHLARLWPGCEGEVELGDEGGGAADDYEYCGDQAKLWERRRVEAKGRLLQALGNARAGVLPDGRRVKRSVVEIAEATIVRKARTEVRLYIPRAKEAEDGDGDATE